MTSKSPDAPKRAGKSKQTEPAETIPRDVEEFVGTVAHEVQSIARLARGLCEADASQQSAALIKRPSHPLDEGVDGESRWITQIEDYARWLSSPTELRFLCQ